MYIFAQKKTTGTKIQPQRAFLKYEFSEGCSYTNQNTWYAIQFTSSLFENENTYYFKKIFIFTIILQNEQQ